jgi:hypothetical protein
VGPRAGLHDMKKLKFLNLPELELRPLSRQQLLYRLALCIYILRSRLRKEEYIYVREGSKHVKAQRAKETENIEEKGWLAKRM